MTAHNAAHTQKIRQLNDAFRRSLVGGKTLVTQGVATRTDLPLIIEKVRTFDAFDEGNDPHQEHDFGAFRIGEQQVFWKIDYYGIDLDTGSPDPSDPSVTKRVMTVMLAEEY